MPIRAPSRAVLHRLAVGVAVAGLVILFDQLSKAAILRALPEGGMNGVIVVLPVLDFLLTWNRGASYSLGAGLGLHGPLFFIALSFVIIVVLFGWMAKSRGAATLIALGAIIGGAITNNLLDRVRFGAVEDFLHFHVGSFAPFGYFNLADSAISLGAVVLVFESLFTPPTSLKNTP